MNPDALRFEESPNKIKQAVDDLLFQLSPEEVNLYERACRELGIGYHEMVATALW